MEPITRFIEQNFGLSFLIGVIAVGGVISGAVWLSIWLYKVITKNKEIERKIDELPCAEHSAKLERIIATETKVDALPCPHHADRIEKHDEQISDIKALSNRIEAKLELLIETLIPKENEDTTQIAETLSRKHSPRTLTEVGVKLLKDSGGEHFLKLNMDYFIKKIEDIAPKTAFDVESLAMRVLLLNRNDDRFIPLKNWVYNAPLQDIPDADGNPRKIDVKLDDVIFVMSLPLRDRYLELHPEIIQ